MSSRTSSPKNGVLATGEGSIYRRSMRNPPEAAARISSNYEQSRSTEPVTKRMKPSCSESVLNSRPFGA